MQMFGVFFQYEVAPLVLQEQIMSRNCLRLPFALPRCSIVSMDYRWIIDGLLMDYLRSKSDNTMVH